MTCVLCDADVTERPSVLVDFESGLAEVCDDCMAKADEPEREAPPDLNREGDPAWNGAWVA